MVADVLSLKWTLLKAGFRRNGWQLAGFVVGLVLGGALAVGAAVGLGALRLVETGVATAVVVVVTAVISFTLFLVPLVATGMDDTLDPSRFSLLPVRSRPLVVGLALGSFVGVAGAVLLLTALGAVVGLSTSVTLAVTAVVAALLWVLLTLVLRNAAAAGITSPSTPRWVRDVAMAVGILLAASSGLASNSVMAGVDSGQEMEDRLHLIADVLGWTPFGLPWAIPRAVAQGQWVDAGLRALMSVVLLVGALWVWERAVAARLVSPLESGGSGKEVSTGMLARLAPDSPAGGVMMRSLINWRRDPRYVMNFAMALLMPVLFVAPMLLQGATLTDLPFLPYVGGAVALSFAMVTMQDTSYDGSALWTHVVSGIRGVQDRWGRFLAVTTVALPVVVIACVVGAAVGGRWDQLPNGLGVSLGLLLVGAGVGQVTSALWQFPAPQPGANQFASPPGSTLATMLAMLVTTVAMGVLAAAAMAGWFATRGAGALHHLLGPAVLVVGALVAWGCIVLSGRWLERRWPEVLAAASEKAS